MDALMAALIAALLIQTSDRAAWLVARLSARYPPAAVVAGAGLAATGANALAALGGALLAPEMSPNARDLLLALALLSAGLGGFWPLKPPPEGARVGAFLAALGGAAILALGDRTVFVTLALAARATVPALAAVGAVLGTLAILGAAALLGERGRRKAPVVAIRVAIGIVLTLAGTAQALSALRLI